MIYSCCRLWLHERGEIAPDVCPACGKTPQLAEVIASAELAQLRAALQAATDELDERDCGNMGIEQRSCEAHNCVWWTNTTLECPACKAEKREKSARKAALTEAAHRFAHAAAVLGVPEGGAVDLAAILADLERME